MLAHAASEGQTGSGEIREAIFVPTEDEFHSF